MYKCQLPSFDIFTTDVTIRGIWEKGILNFALFLQLLVSLIILK
jgi:hypothetical protein